MRSLWHYFVETAIFRYYLNCNPLFVLLYDVLGMFLYFDFYVLAIEYWLAME